MNGEPASIDERMQLIIEELQRGGITLEQAARAFDEKYVHLALKASKGNITQAALRLGLHRNTILNRLRENDDLRVKPKRRVFGRGRW